MAKDKISMPSTTAGITRYFEDYESKIKFKPGHIIVIILIIIILIVILQSLAQNWLA